MCCATAIVKALLYLFTLVFFVCGAALLGVGIWLVATDEGIALIEQLGIPSAQGASDVWKVSVYLMISIGAFIFLVGIVGCAGVANKSRCLIFFFVGMLSLCLVAEVVVAILAVVYNRQIDESVSEEMKKEVSSLYSSEDAIDHDHPSAVSYTWNLMQHQFKCCGSTGYEDYKNSTFERTSNQTVPYECCVQSSSKALSLEQIKDEVMCRQAAHTPGLVSSEYLYTQGCYDAIKEWISKHSLIIMAAGFSFAGIQIIGILLGTCLLNLWTKDEK